MALKQYKDLDLKSIREAADLDFAHWTYKKGMCSCCYGPRDLPELYWKNHKKAEEGQDFTYILFKNASNGRGTVSKNDFIENCTYIEHHVSSDQMDTVCRMLQEQLGSGYVVVKPEYASTCISIYESEWFAKNINSIA